MIIIQELLLIIHPKKHNNLYSSALDVVDSASGFLRSRDTYLSKRT